MTDHFIELFTNLQTPSGGHGLNVNSVLVQVRGLDVLVGRDSNGQPHLLIENNSGQDNFEPRMMAEKMKLSVRSLVSPAGEKSFFDFTCLSSDADELFAAICQDAVYSLNQSNDFVSLEASFSETLEKWRAILKSLGTSEPTISEKVGLVGELIALVCLSRKFGDIAVEGWLGQDKTRHDFEFESLAFEAKASLSTSGERVSIHGFGQLSSAPGTKLCLLFTQFEIAAEGLTISKVLESFGENQNKVRAKLVKFWPFDDVRPVWFDDMNFKIVSIKKFEVDNDFPKLLKPALQSERYVSVEYGLNLEGLACLKAESLDKVEIEKLF